jgi:hypothetical protein
MEDRYVESTSCSVCLEQYDVSSHVPMILPCEHTFCRTCLDALPRDDVCFKCPMCREQHEAGAGVTNRALLELMEALPDPARPPAQQKLQCSTHADTACRRVCVDCLQAVCDACLRTPAHAQHDVQDAATAKAILTHMAKKRVKAIIDTHQKQVAMLEVQCTELEQFSMRTFREATEEERTQIRTYVAGIMAKQREGTTLKQSIQALKYSSEEEIAGLDMKELFVLCQSTEVFNDENRHVVERYLKTSQQYIENVQRKLEPICVFCSGKATPASLKWLGFYGLQVVPICHTGVSRGAYLIQWLHQHRIF